MMTTPQDLADRLEKARLEAMKALRCLYIAVEELVADDVNEKVRIYIYIYIYISQLEAALRQSAPASGEMREGFKWVDDECSWRGIRVGSSYNAVGHIYWTKAHPFLAEAYLADRDKKNVGWFSTSELARSAVEGAVLAALRTPSGETGEEAEL